MRLWSTLLLWISIYYITIIIIGQLNIGTVDASKRTKCVRGLAQYAQGVPKSSSSFQIEFSTKIAARFLHLPKLWNSANQCRHVLPFDSFQGRERERANSSNISCEIFTISGRLRAKKKVEGQKCAAIYLFDFATECKVRERSKKTGHKIQYH